MVSEPRSSRLTTLERYVASPDPSYRWRAIAALRGGGYTTHLIELVSQCWRDVSEVDRPRWQHQLRLVVPDEIATDAALLVIAGGSNDRAAEAQANPLLAIAAVMTRSVTAELRMVPNQPLTFAGETDPRAEDGIINGRMGHTPFKAPLRRFRFLRKPSSNGFRKDDYPATRSPKECLGKSTFRTRRSLS